MRIPFLHPALDELADLADSRLAPPRQATVARHVERCARCQDAMRFVTRLTAERASHEGPPASDALLERILSSRATGARTILPIPASGVAESAAKATRSARPVSAVRWGLAAAAVLVLATLVTTRSSDLTAAESESRLEMTPAHPRAGDTLRVRYIPAAALFSNERELRLRARIRTPRNEMYNDGLPVMTVAMLRRERDGTFSGRFVLPDSVVFAALAVEDTAARSVDDRGRRLWEVAVHDADTMPAFDALMQRANDMMGRSWEEGYATARRLAALYPDRLEAWTTLDLFERSLNEGATADSVARKHAERIAALTAGAKKRAALREAEIDAIFFRAWTKTWRGASAADSAELAYWWARLQREHPRSRQITQRIAVDLRRANMDRPRVVLDSLERAYPALLASGARLQQNFFLAGRFAAEAARDDAAYRRWHERMYAGSADSARIVSLALARRAAFRADGIAGLRGELARTDVERVRPRALTENATRYGWVLKDRRQAMLAALGRALIAEGAVAAGIDTLERATEHGWDVELLRELARAHAANGNAAAAARMGARLVVDPRTAPSERDSLRAAARSVLDESAWARTAADARTTMIARTLERSTPVAVRGTPRLTGADGRVSELRALTGGKTAVVIFWSPYCGPALQHAPAIEKIATRLRNEGTPVLLVVTDPPSAELNRLVKERGFTIPVHHDVGGTMTRGFANFGTPAYYVLDGLGRIRFALPPDEETLLVQVEALRGGSGVSVAGD